MTLSLRQISLKYTLPDGKFFRVLENINLDIPQGKIIGLLGESGSGKSSIAALIPGIQPQNAILESGHIIYQEQTYRPTEEAYHQTVRGKKVAMIFQESQASLNPVIKIGKQLEAVIKKYKVLSSSEIKQEALKFLEQVMLNPADRFYNSYPHQISGGQAQRVQIAIALACGADILIADEPTASLDPENSSIVVELLKALRTQNKSVLLITHDMQVVQKLADYVYIIAGGKLVAEGAYNTLLNDPPSAYIKEILSSKFEGIVPHLRQEMSKPHLLTVQNLSFSYKPSGFLNRNSTSTQVLNNFSLQAHEREIIGITGKSGTGKSTLARIIAGLEQPDSGQIMFKGMPVKSRSTRAKKVQMIFQDSFEGLNPAWTIKKILHQALNDSGKSLTKTKRYEEILNYLKMVELTPEILDRYRNQISGGQRQRVCIARALIMMPEILIADECLASLDSNIQKSILFLLQKIVREKQMALLFISHDTEAVEAISNRIIILSE